jgi:hypothetical protein
MKNKTKRKIKEIPKQSKEKINTTEQKDKEIKVKVERNVILEI